MSDAHVPETGDYVDDLEGVREPRDLTGAPLEPMLFEELAVELFTDQTVTRQTLCDEVVRVHRERGGLPPTRNPASTAKAALRRLQKRGLAAPAVGKGRWNIGPAGDAPSHVPLAPGLGLADQPGPLAVPTRTVTADRVTGHGQSYVYLYYLPVYRTMAEQAGADTWECKVGMTTVDPLGRVIAQAGTALPERPRVALVIRTNQAAVLETAIHAVLTLRGRKAQSAVGSEWFLTNADEVEAIADWIGVLEEPPPEESDDELGDDDELDDDSAFVP
jgi:hypothetical protein